MHCDKLNAYITLFCYGLISPFHYFEWQQRSIIFITELSFLGVEFPIWICYRGHFSLPFHHILRENIGPHIILDAMHMNLC